MARVFAFAWRRGDAAGLDPKDHGETEPMPAISKIALIAGVAIAAVVIVGKLNSATVNTSWLPKAA